MTHNTFESNLYNSFARVKSDILRLSKEVSRINKAVNGMIDQEGKANSKIEKLNSRVDNVEKRLNENIELMEACMSKETTIVKDSSSHKKKAKTYIASKRGKKFHIPECIFAKNIKPKSIVKFKSKEAMLNNGYKPCDCVRK